MGTIQLIQTTPEQLVELINKGVKSQLKDFQKQITSKDLNDELLTRKEACEYLKIDSSTLWAWTNKRKVKAYGIANRRYYKRSELIESLILVKK
jgi:DNA-binding NtrC family response regulator